ncbi:hypothetical protein L208DRAFT_1391936 [Tricholoma matsutake]|nr:hypothetical protein L208DRAFT_1391936 [Tricholoma matsutake 945]
MATIAGAVTAAVTAAVHSSRHADNWALHTSILTGQRQLNELLTGSCSPGGILCYILSDL